MKKTDIAMIILIAAISVTAAFFITKSIMGDPSEEVVKVPTAEKFTSEVATPDPAVFNSNAINPAVKIELEEGSSQ